MNEIPDEELGAVTPVLRLPQLDHLEEEGVNIQCINSSDFVIGKQTNFNGPVTIITCADVLKQRLHEGKEEKIVIRDPVLSPSAAKQMQNLAEEKQKAKEDGQQHQSLVKNLAKVAMKLPSLFCLVIIFTIIAVAVFYGLTVTGEEPPKECLLLSNFTCLYSPKFLSTEEPLEGSAVYVVIFQTHDEFCYETEECKKISAEYRERGKVKCHFLVGGEGNIYEGVDWDRKNTSKALTDILNICMMGNFTTDFPTYPQIIATTVLIQFGVDSGFISENYVLTASNATTPGDYLSSIYNIIKKWPNFHENPFGSQISYSFVFPTRKFPESDSE